MVEHVESVEERLNKLEEMLAKQPNTDAVALPAPDSPKASENEESEAEVDEKTANQMA